MAAGVVRAAREKGVYTYLKHFALNEQETNREGVLTWADEQTMREIYFRPFEMRSRKRVAGGHVVVQPHRQGLGGRLA